MRVSVTERAWEDVRRNARWWAENRSQEQAATWYDDIRAAIAALADRPHQWPTAREDLSFSFEIREYHFRIGGRATHRIVFTIGDDSVVVLAVVHVSQQDLDPAELLNEP